jgi:hypothetical protein
MSAFSERDAALARVMPKAEEACPGFAGLARAFVVSFLRLKGIATGEEITDAAIEAGIQPHDARAFGGVFLSLSKRGVIERRGFALRRKGHNTPGASIWTLK